MSRVTSKMSFRSRSTSSATATIKQEEIEVVTPPFPKSIIITRQTNNIHVERRHFVGSSDDVMQDRRSWLSTQFFDSRESWREQIHILLGSCTLPRQQREVQAFRGGIWSFYLSTIWKLRSVFIATKSK